jgi:hypothetical protein
MTARGPHEGVGDGFRDEEVEGMGDEEEGAVDGPVGPGADKVPHPRTVIAVIARSANRIFISYRTTPQTQRLFQNARANGWRWSRESDAPEALAIAPYRSCRPYRSD